MEEAPARGGPPARHPHRRRRRRRLVVSLAVLAGFVVVIALAGATGIVIGATHGMPSLSMLQRKSLPQTTRIYDKKGRLIARVHGATDRLVVGSARIPRAMKEATVAIEDKRFYQHHGVDPVAIARAAAVDLRAGHIVQGASTITEQYIKNAYLYHQDGVLRKIREAVLAWELENRWSKDQILTAYLNTVYYGSGAYGVEAAAQVYFHRDVSELTLAQCALLAALPRFPDGYSPIYAPKEAKKRRNLVLALMAEQGYITSHRRAQAAGKPLGVFDRPPAQQRGPAAYFVQYVTEQLVHRYGARETFEGGLKVYTSLDMRMQLAGVRALKETLPKGPAGALVSIDPANGDVRAMVSTTDWRTKKFNLAWQSQRQLGSAMKPFALAAAVQQGADPANSYYVSKPLQVYLGAGSVPPYWDVNTFSNTYAGTINLVQATWQSDNTVYAQLALDLGPDRIVRMAHRMGIVSPLHPYPSIVLGTESVNPLEVADAYATFASEGVRHRPRSILRVVYPDGKVVRNHVRSRRALPAGAAYVVAKILEGNTKYGTAAAMPLYYQGVSAGKTGTTSGSVDAWFCGFNPKLATAVWMGYPKGEVPMPGVQGATYCVPVWGKYYAMVFGDRTIPDFRQPAKMPAYRPWTGQYAVGSPAASPPVAPSPSASTAPATTPSTPTPSSTP